MLPAASSEGVWWYTSEMVVATNTQRSGDRIPTWTDGATWFDDEPVETMKHLFGGRLRHSLSLPSPPLSLPSPPLSFLSSLIWAICLFWQWWLLLCRAAAE